MSLDAYRRARMIVLNPQATAYEAACAMSANNVGAVVVADARRVVGIVTDRDLTLEIIGSSGDAKNISLYDVMSDEVVTIDVNETVDQVLRLMKTHRIRRVPVTEHGHPVGLVTLDDLVADRAIDIAAAAAVVERQLEQAAPRKPEGTRFPVPASRAAGTRGAARRVARARAAYDRLLHAVMDRAGVANKDAAERALSIVLCSLVKRVTPEAARHFIPQLPSMLQPALERCAVGPDRRITSEMIAEEVMGELQVDEPTAFEVIVSICDAVASCLSAGEIENFRGQLPIEMKDLFPPTPMRRTG
jgi:uncharacterized protein (DUF2267 family)